MRLSTPPVHAGGASACPFGRTLRSWRDVFPCGTAVRAVGSERYAPLELSFPPLPRRAPSREAADGYTCPQARTGTGRMGTQAALTTILYVYDTPDNNRTRTIVYC